jgi:hypothetical protein
VLLLVGVISPVVDRLQIPIRLRSTASMNAFPLGVAPRVLKKVRDRNRFLVPIWLARSHT